jgi:dihydrofolate synthase / folylpolyglutamate synthase
MTYPDSVHFLYSLGNEIKTAKLGLDRIRAVLDALGSPHLAGRVVHVAGTNGKGSTCAMIEAALRAAGRRTGLYTSPHLAEPTERIRVGGDPVPAARFAEAFDAVHRKVEVLLEAGAIDLHTTYFETVTAMAFVIFAEEQVDDGVIEVGLGGRLDATNVVIPELCVITPVDFDHEQFLGTSVAAIAAEKAGILKAGVPAVFARQRPEAQEALDRRAAELAIPVARTGGWQISALDVGRDGSRFHLSGEIELDLFCPLAGEHQVENAATAAVALCRLGLGAPAIESGIAQARWPGRLEQVATNPAIILDGAHNPAGARALAAYIDRFYPGQRVILIFGAMRDKSVAEIAGVLFPRAAAVIATAPKQARALKPETIVQASEHPGVRTAPDVAAALEMAHAAGADAIFVTGSLFLVAEARALLAGAPLL